MRQILKSVLMIVGFLAFGATAEAMLVVVADFDPNAPILTETTVTSGTPVTVDIWLSGNATPGIAGFQFSLNFDESFLNVPGAVSSGSFLSPFPFINIQNVVDNANGLVNFGETIFDFPIPNPAQTKPAGRLASITFDTMGLGTTELTFSLGGLFPTQFSDPDAAAISFTPVKGTIHIVPIPGAALLFGSGLIGLIGIARRKALRTQN